MTNQVFTPEYEIKVDGQNVTSRIAPRLLNLALVDNRGFEADTLSLTLDDADGSVALPRRDAKISVKIGWQGSALIDKGDFVIDGIGHSGAPDTISVSAKSADFRKKMLEQKNKAYHDKTIKEVINEIAGVHELTAKVSDDLADIKITDKQQKNESDANFLSRLAEEFDAIATIKKGNLLFLKAGESKSASGSELPTIKITRKDGDNHSYSINDRDAYTGVKAKWNSAKGGKRKEVLAGDEEKTKMLRTTYKSEEEAQRAAENELKRLKRGNAAFSFTLAQGNPELMAESPVEVTGFKTEIDEQTWVCIRVTTNLNDSGLTSTVEAEIKEISEKQ